MAVLAVLALGTLAAQPSLAQDRTLATLADVPALVPAPHHPQAITAVYSSSLFDPSGNTHFWR